MRDQLLEFYVQRASNSSPLVVLTADLGYSLFTREWEKFANVTCINVGIAEQNMIGLAAGMALCNRRVLCYSMASFLCLRAAEQIKVDLCLDNQDVVLIGAASGLTCGLEGPTHHAVEDIAILAGFPNIKILCPSNSKELLSALEILGDQHGPLYVRIGMDDAMDSQAPRIHAKIGAPLVLKRGTDVCIFSHGSMVMCASEVARLLEHVGISCTVVSCPWLKPFDGQEVSAIAAPHQLVVTIEEHSIHGGLTSLVAVCLATGFAAKPLLPFCVSPDAYEAVGARADLLEMQGLTPICIFEKVAYSMRALSGD